MGNWVKRNWVNILVFAVIASLLGRFFSDKSFLEIVQSSWAILLVVFGLSFVIFIHELGHFVAAKWCGVRVHTFSIGFGPPIPGLHFRKGETEYKVAAFPLGGYVQMLGQEDPGVEAKEGFGADDPRSYKNKTVGQRMVIISAGVIMNVILGLVCFVYVYLTGKTEVSGRLGAIEPGSPADVAGLQAGSELLQLNDNFKPTYEDLFFTGAFATPGETEIYLRWRTPAGEEKQATVTPRRKDKDPKPLIGIAPPVSHTLMQAARPGRSPGYPDTPAADAAFLPGDKIIGVRLAEDKNDKQFRPIKSGWDLIQAEFDYRGKTVIFQVERGDGEDKHLADVEVAPQFMHTLGLRMEIGPIVSVGADSSAKDKLQAGDLLVEVDGDKSFDPMRLPELMADKAGQTVKLSIQRSGQQDPLAVEVVPQKGRVTSKEEPSYDEQTPLSIPSLGVTYMVRTTVREVEKGSPADGRLRPGDVIAGIGFRSSEESKPSVRNLEADHWAGAFWTLQLGTGKIADLKVQRAGGEPETISLTAVEDRTWPMPDRGFILERDTQIIHADDVFQAIQLGFRDTYRTIGRIYLNLKGLVTGMLSPKLVHGPIGIVQMTYGMAERGINDLLLFLGMISINLAVINFLPIPILDGGHMVFLLWEKAAGKPANEKAQIVANIIGLALLGCLMLFVIFLDISKWF